MYRRLAEDRVDVLLVPPKRLGNPEFAEQAGPLLGRAGCWWWTRRHCISDWGFDFRPDYQRTSRRFAGMAPGATLLATTATANERVTADVAAQLGVGTLALRGPLARASLRLAVVPGPVRLGGRGAGDAARLGHRVRADGGAGRLAGRVPGRAGPPGGRVHRADRRGGAVPDRSRAAEQPGQGGVATSALGMGYDKPDLGFCLHVGSPNSPVAYYQQVGRAGRAVPTGRRAAASG